jgi:repressor LexA
MPPNYADVHERQERDVLELIVDHLTRGLPIPTNLEIAERLGMTHATQAWRVIQRLQQKGQVEAPSGHRNIKLTGSAGRVRISMPHRSPVSCGPGIEVEDTDDELDLVAMFKRDDLVAYTAVGKSMVEAGIQPGDILVVRECPTPESGQKIVAMLDRKMLCKKYHPTGDGLVELRSCNPDVKPIVVDPSRGHFRILGVLYTLIRKF